MVVSLSILGCQMKEIQTTFKDECGILRSNVDWSNRIKVLNLLSLAFSQKCDAAVIEYTEQAQSGFRDKTFLFLGKWPGFFYQMGYLRSMYWNHMNGRI